MDHVIRTPNLWEQVSATWVNSAGTPRHRSPHPTSTNNGHETRGKWDEKTKDDGELWWEKQNLLWACHVSRSKDRMNNDGSFVTHQFGAISSTFPRDWYRHKGESRDKMGEWLKKATVRSQDQRRMLQANTHSFPSNYW